MPAGCRRPDAERPYGIKLTVRVCWIKPMTVKQEPNRLYEPSIHLRPRNCFEDRMWTTGQRSLAMWRGALACSSYFLALAGPMRPTAVRTCEATKTLRSGRREDDDLHPGLHGAPTCFD